MSNSRVDFLYLNEEEMVKLGVTDMKGCVESMEEGIMLWEVLMEILMGAWFLFRIYHLFRICR